MSTNRLNLNFTRITVFFAMSSDPSSSANASDTPAGPVYQAPSGATIEVLPSDQAPSSAPVSSSDPAPVGSVDPAVAPADPPQPSQDDVTYQQWQDEAKTNQLVQAAPNGLSRTSGILYKDFLLLGSTLYALCCDETLASLFPGKDCCLTYFNAMKVNANIKLGCFVDMFKELIIKPAVWLIVGDDAYRLEVNCSDTYAGNLKAVMLEFYNQIAAQQALNKKAADDAAAAQDSTSLSSDPASSSSAPASDAASASANAPASNPPSNPAAAVVVPPPPPPK